MLSVQFRELSELSIWKSVQIIMGTCFNREGKSLRHVSMVGIFLDDNKPIK